MKKIINITLLGALFALSSLPILAATNETLAKIRENSLVKAMELLKGKNASVDEVLKTAKQIEDYILADEESKNRELPILSENPDDFEKKQQVKIKSSSTEENINFMGFSLGINGQVKSTSAKTTFDGITFDGVGQQNFIGNVQADYEFKISEKYGLLIGGTIDLNDNEILKINANGNFFKGNEKNHYSLFLAPTYHFSDDTLGYLSLAYHHSKIETSNNLGSSDISHDLNGYGLGVGVRSQIYNNIYANLQVQRVMYTTDSILSADLGTGSSIGSFGLSYSFADEKNKNNTLNTHGNKFNGLSIGIGGLLKSSSIKASGSSGLSSGSFDSIGQQNIGVVQFVDYAFRLSDKSLILIGGTFDLNDTDTLKISGYGNEVKIKEKNHYSLFLAPAYQLSKNSIGFLKLAYHHAEFDFEASANNFYGAKVNYSMDFDGYGVGFGIRNHILDNLYANFEVQRVFYGRKNISPLNLDIDSTIGTLGLSYKF